MRCRLRVCRGRGDVLRAHRQLPSACTLARVVRVGARAWAGLCLTALAISCLPFAGPPAKVGFAVGPGVVPQSALPAREQRGGVASQLSAGFYPLGWLEAAAERAGDIGVGYMLERYSDAGPPLHGPFVDLELFLWRHALDGHSFRLGSIATPSLIFFRDEDRGGQAGVGMDLKLELELYGFSGGELFGGDADDAGFGYAHGEWSLGVWVGGGYRDVFGADVWTSWLGFSGRWPAVAGVLCCWLPGDD